jgi:hypothetical protein
MEKSLFVNAARNDQMWRWKMLVVCQVYWPRVIHVDGLVSYSFTAETNDYLNEVCVKGVRCGVFMFQ